MDQNLGWSSVVDGNDMSPKFRQIANSTLFTETVTQQDASYSIENSVADVAFATKSIKNHFLRSSDSGSPPVKLLPTPLMGKV